MAQKERDDVLEIFRNALLVAGVPLNHIVRLTAEAAKELDSGAYDGPRLVKDRPEESQ